MSEYDNDKSKPIKVVFSEGCFDDFEGTQEELDELVSKIQEMAASGELAENMIPVDEFEDIDEEVLDLLPLLSTGNTRH